MDIRKITNSSALEGYTYQDDELTIYFKDGSVETYLEVPYKVIEELHEAKSAGLYFNLSIRNNFKRG